DRIGLRRIAIARDQPAGGVPAIARLALVAGSAADATLAASRRAARYPGRVSGTDLLRNASPGGALLGCISAPCPDGCRRVFLTVSLPPAQPRRGQQGER